MRYLLVIKLLNSKKIGSTYCILVEPIKLTDIDIQMCERGKNRCQELSGLRIYVTVADGDFLDWCCGAGEEDQIIGIQTVHTSDTVDFVHGSTWNNFCEPGSVGGNLG